MVRRCTGNTKEELPNYIIFKELKSALIFRMPCMNKGVSPKEKKKVMVIKKTAVDKFLKDLERQTRT